MGRYREPVCRLCRREGLKLFLKGSRCFTDKCAFERREYAPGVHGRVRKKSSDYGVQLREKQKIKRTYGLGESQFRLTFRRAAKAKGVTGDTLLQLLERRFDNVIYRMGFSTSRAEARMFIRHNHFLRNGKKANIASISLKEGDVITLSESGKKTAKILEAFDTAERRGVCPWMETDKKERRGVLKAYPKREELSMPMEEHLVVELYSK